MPVSIISFLFWVFYIHVLETSCRIQAVIFFCYIFSFNAAYWYPYHVTSLCWHFLFFSFLPWIEQKTVFPHFPSFLKNLSIEKKQFESIICLFCLDLGILFFEPVFVGLSHIRRESNSSVLAAWKIILVEKISFLFNPYLLFIDQSI